MAVEHFDEQSVVVPIDLDLHRLLALLKLCSVSSDVSRQS